MDKQKMIDWLKENKAPEDVLKFAETLNTLDLKSVEDFLSSDESGKKYLQSQKDAAVTKGIDTFKEKTMPDLIESKIKEKFPEETEAEKQLRQLSDNQKRLEAEIKQKDLLNKAISVANEKKLPLKIIDKFIGSDEETTVQNIELLESVYSEAIKTAVEEKFKESGRETTGGGTPPADDPSKMTDDEFFNSKISEEK